MTEYYYLECSVCGVSIRSNQSIEETQKRYEDTFGDEATEDEKRIVCDPCYKQFLEWWKGKMH